MFLLSKIQDSVQVQPQDLGKTPVDAIRAELEASYYDKVLPEIGLAGKHLGLTQLSASAAPAQIDLSCEVGLLCSGNLEHFGGQLRQCSPW